MTGAAPRGIEVRGPFRGISGYDHHVRELVRALDRLGVRVRLDDPGIWRSDPLPAEKADPWFESLRSAAGAGLVLHVAMPHHAVPEPGRVNVLDTMFEADRVHPAWVEMSRSFELVVVPTESSRRAWVASGFPADRVRLCPLGVDSELYRGEAEPLPLDLDDGLPLGRCRLRFLNVSEFGIRKNLTGLLRTWVTATSRADDAVLILKLSSRDEPYARLLDQLTGADGAPIVFVRERFSDVEMRRLYATATHYLSLSFGEGWDLPMTEAAAAGLQLIAPRHSAYLDYLDDECAYLVDSLPVAAQLEPGHLLEPLFRGACWWQPDEAQAAGVIRALVDGTAPARAQPRERVLRELSWEAAARRRLELLTDRERPQPRRSYASAVRAAMRRR